MIRIHAGLYKGQTIKRPKIETTKETASMVREAVFNTLFSINGNVLDLFAGSGSYGITAKSLGADNVIFIDNNEVAVEAIRFNINKLGFNDESKVHKTDFKLYLKTSKLKFDYIFLDPPYKFEDYLELLELVSLYATDECKIILEVDKRSEEIETFNNFEKIRSKNYGSKKIVIYSNY